MAGEITRRELHPDLLEELLAGGGSMSGAGKLIYDVVPVTITADTVREVPIPKDGFILGKHTFEVRIGGIAIPQDKYTIQNNKIILASSEGDFPVGRRLDFVFIYLEQTADNELPVDGANINVGTVSKDKLTKDIQAVLDKPDLTLGAKPADVEIEGRTLMNLLGRYGNAIYKQFSTGHAYGTVGYENDAYTLSNTADNAWVTTLGTTHEFTKDKYYVTIADIYLDTGDNAYVSIVNATTTGDTSLLATYDKGTWKTCCYRCKMGAPADGHPKPYFVMAVAGSAPSAKFKNARVYEITEAEYNALEGMTREQVGEKYPYVDDIKCVMNPYVECKENLLASSKLTPQYSYDIYNGSQIISAGDIRATFLGKTYIKPNTKYILSADVAIDIPNLEVRASIFNGSNPMIWDTD